MNFGLTPDEKRIDDLLINDLNDPVEKELFRWFMFALNNKGQSIQELNILNFEAFKKRLTLMLDAVYYLKKRKLIKYFFIINNN